MREKSKIKIYYFYFSHRITERQSEATERSDSRPLRAVMLPYGQHSQTIKTLRNYEGKNLKLKFIIFIFLIEPGKL
jgi:hypothetical protein